jgi:hypothetical protein
MSFFFLASKNRGWHSWPAHSLKCKEEEENNNMDVMLQLILERSFLK